MTYLRQHNQVVNSKIRNKRLCAVRKQKLSKDIINNNEIHEFISFTIEDIIALEDYNDRQSDIDILVQKAVERQTIGVTANHLAPGRGNIYSHTDFHD
jgi:hypothetical protein